MRVLLLGEKLIAFRDTNGRVGLVAEQLPPSRRVAVLRPQRGGGLRCVYHGWKFDVDGACVDMPNEPAESNFKDKVRAVAYPTQERGGVVWAYMGPARQPPPLPDLEAEHGAGRRRQVSATMRECNWLQGAGRRHRHQPSRLPALRRTRA